VKIDEDALGRYYDKLTAAGATIDWDEHGWHFNDDAAGTGELTCLYVMLIDAINFCFWPTEGFEYEQLASNVAKVFRESPEAVSPSQLAKVDAATLQAWVGGFELNQLEERARMLRQLGEVLDASFDGSAAKFVATAGGSAVELTRLVSAWLPGFRDETVYRGMLVPLYKRAQIFVGDVWAAFGRNTESGHFASFHDIGALTMFADYRIPQLLAAEGVLVYAPPLAEAIAAQRCVEYGSEEETEIRACTVVAVEKLRALAAARGVAWTSVEIDWKLWQIGEESLDTLPPHHRTLTVFY
jgi:hypothetical protein